MFIFEYSFYLGLSVIFLTLILSQPSLKPDNYKPSKGRRITFSYTLGLILLIYGWSIESSVWGLNNSWIETIIYVLLCMMAFGAFLESRSDFPLLPKQLLKAVENLKDDDPQLHSAFLIDVEQNGLINAVTNTLDKSVLDKTGDAPKNEFTVQEYTHQDIDFSIVKSLLDQSQGGMVNDNLFTSLDFPALEQQVAILAVKERQLMRISIPFRNMYNIAERSNKDQFTTVLALSWIGAAYQELDEESKDILLLLFFSPDMLTENSIYIPERPIRNYAYEAFETLLEGDGIAIETLKKNFLHDEKLGYLLPLEDHIKNINN